MRVLFVLGALEFVNLRLAAQNPSTLYLERRP